MKLFSGISALLFVFVMLWSGVAQAQTNFNEFKNNPYLVPRSTAPVNAVTSASQTITYTANPAAAGTLVIYLPNGLAETYTFFATTYTTPTATTLNMGAGVKIATDVDDTFTTFCTRVNSYSKYVRATINTGTDVVTITTRHPYYGSTGNSIRLTDGLTNTVLGAGTATALAGGISVSAGRAGALWWESHDSTFKLWIKTSNSTTLADVWKYATFQ